MRVRICGGLILAVVGGITLSAAGQVDGVRTTGSAGRVARPARLPYTAEFKTTHVQTLANGSTITRETTEVLARDSQGRTLNSSTSTPQAEGQAVHTDVNINDPVAHTHTYWSTLAKRVTVRILQDPGAQQSSTCASSIVTPVVQSETVQRQNPTMEDLGKQTFLGVEAKGHRSTWTTPAGEIGNSEPLVRVNEVWFSTTPGLPGINVRQMVDDPRTGKTTRELVKFTPGEPDATLFQPPQEFEVVTQEEHDEVRCPQ
ncbi:MAG: hypothetical protein ABSD67_10265 [Terracidiphilus sp.]|jgi:hypothetical protein